MRQDSMGERRLRVAILTPTFSRFSGIDRVVESEAEEYARKGHEVSIFALAGEIKPKKAKLYILGIPKNPLLERIYRLLFFLDIPKLVNYTRMLRNYDLVVSHCYPMNILACLSKKFNGNRYLYYNAGVAFPWVFGSTAEKLYMHLFSFFNKLSIMNADDAISISNFLRKELKKETGLDSRVVYVRIDRKRFNERIDMSGIRKIIDKHGLKGHTCLFVGRVSPHKGVHLLIQAFKLVQKRIPDAQLLIVGKHTFDAYSKKLNQGAVKNIIFTGFVEDSVLPFYYGACQVYATASLWEGFDMPAVEAQACGKPVVAFDVCSHPEVVKNGVLVRPGDIKGFAEGMEKMMKKD